MVRAKKKPTTSKAVKPAAQPDARPPAHVVIEVTEVGGEDLPELLERLWKQFQAGDNQALFDLIIWQLSCGKLPALEARTEFIARYHRWRLGDVRTLDEAFGVQRRKGKHLRVRRLRGNRSSKRASREQYRHHIVVRVYELHLDEGLPIDRELFEIVAKELGLARSTVEEIYYESTSRAWRRVAATGLLRVTPRKTEN